jgi:hypothetical protein
MSKLDEDAFEESYLELSPEGQRKVKLYIKFVLYCLQCHEKEYNEHRRPSSILDKGYKLNIGESGAKELIAVLMKERLI